MKNYHWCIPLSLTIYFWIFFCIILYSAHIYCFVLFSVIYHLAMILFPLQGDKTVDDFNCEVTTEDFLSAVETLVPSVSPEQYKQYQAIRARIERQWYIGFSHANWKQTLFIIVIYLNILRTKLLTFLNEFLLLVVINLHALQM